MSEIHLQNIKDLGFRDRYSAAFDLSDATQTQGINAIDLAKELPLPYKGYRKPIRGARRLKIVAERAIDAGLVGHVVKRDKKAIGMATLQAHNPTPDLLPAKVGAEASYWLGIRHLVEAMDIGNQVLSKLVQVGKSVPNDEVVDTLWMATLPDDRVKPRVCEANGFEPAGPLQPYNIGDEVYVARQLWVREL